MFITLFIAAGAGLMVWNIKRFLAFIHSTNDVLSSGNQRDLNWMKLCLILVIFFLIGYLYVGFFSDPDMMMAQILFWGSVFVAIVLTLMFHMLETAKKRSLDITEVLVGVIEARDPNLNGHSRQVAELTMLLYSRLPQSIKNAINPVSLEYAALIHDIGKLGVPESILNKPGKLTPEEWDVMRTHPKTGVTILKPLDTFDKIAPWIEYHHEQMDGKGYYGLPKEKIPLAARIIAIADTYSTITMRRSYKAPMTHEDAVRIIREVAGTQLDKEMCDIFLSIPKEELEKCIPEEIKY